MMTPGDVIAALPPSARRVRLPTLLPNGGSRHSPRHYITWRARMPSAPADPPLFYSRHIFCCTNVRPEGHPRGCCSAGGSEKLRAYMREKARSLGIENIRVNASGCLDRCELGPNM